MQMNPKLRAIRPEQASVNGQPVIVLRDPLGISERTVVVPQALGLLLALCDGTRDESGLRAAFQVRTGLYLSPDRLAEILRRLDEALLLDNDAFRAACAQALAAYRAAPHRPPALAGQGYPADLGELASYLDGLLAGAPSATGSAPLRGLVSPHIDYQRGGAVYAQAWQRAAVSAQEADLAVILGTDHQSDGAPVTATRQSYATPWGVLPTEVDVVEALVQAAGADVAFAEELHHRGEHSIELAAVWLHHVRGGRPLPVVPVLCGSFQRFISDDDAPADDEVLGRLIEALRAALAGRRALVVAAADLAHSGPAVGDPFPAGIGERAHARQADEALLAAACQGDAEGFFAQVKAEGDRRHVCGLAPIYLALRLLEPVRGEPAGYGQAPADRQGSSFVSFCGIALV